MVGISSEYEPNRVNSMLLRLNELTPVLKSSHVAERGSYDQLL